MSGFHSLNGEEKGNFREGNADKLPKGVTGLNTTNDDTK